MNIIYLGDISLNDNYVKHFKDGKNPFKDVEKFLHDSDFVVGNLECMTVGISGENTLKKPRLFTTIDTLNYLNNINLKVACLAHNHVYDNLEDGFLNTIRFLNDNGINYLGASTNKEDFHKPMIIEKNGVSIGLLNYLTEDTYPNLPINAKVYLNIFNEYKVTRDIKSLKSQVNHVVLLLHWGGNVEGGLYPDWEQPKIARRLIDAGADLIVGHHSHTVQPYEVYKGKHIFYSLGNFCFSDILFEGKLFPLTKKRKKGAILKVIFTKYNYNVVMLIVQNKNEFLSLKYPSRINTYTKNMFFKFLFCSKSIWKLYYFKNKHIRPVVDFIFNQDISFKNKIIRGIDFIIKKMKQ